jgi:hypothetical protein
MEGDMRPPASLGLTLGGVALTGGLIYHFIGYLRAKPPLEENRVAASKTVRTGAEVMEAIHLGMTKADVQSAIGDVAAGGKNAWFVSSVASCDGGRLR